MRKWPYLELIAEILATGLTMIPRLSLKPLNAAKVESVAGSPSSATSQHPEAGCQVSDSRRRLTHELWRQGVLYKALEIYVDCVADFNTPKRSSACGYTLLSGPMRLLLFSQKLRDGYMAYRIPGFRTISQTTTYLYLECRAKFPSSTLGCFAPLAEMVLEALCPLRAYYKFHQRMESWSR